MRACAKMAASPRTEATRTRLIMVLLWGGLASMGCALLSDLSDLSEGAGGAGSGPLGEGGAGGGITLDLCISATDCPAPTQACETAACIGGECATVAMPAGAALPSPQQTAGDCTTLVCGPTGEPIPQNDTSDVPVDGTSCTLGECISGQAFNEPAPLGSTCERGSGVVCDDLGGCVECNVAEDCSGLPPSDECQQRSCIGGICHIIFATEGTEVTAQSTGDCKIAVCDGAGAVRQDALERDLPDDGNECTVDDCSGATPTFVNIASTPAAPCGSAGFCDGAGQCVGCVTGADCGTDDSCKSYQCVANTCIISYAGPGVTYSPQVAGDCQKLVCNGTGGTVTQTDNGDVPANDGNECTSETCVSGSPQHPARPMNYACGALGTSYCDGAGNCVQCNSASQCPAAGPCLTTTCNANTCGSTPTPDGTVAPAASQTSFDCKVVKCNGSGGTYSEPQSSDLPFDDNQCTGDVCTGGVPSNPPAALGFGCNENGGTACNGAGACVPCVNDAPCGAQYCDLGSYQCVDKLSLGAKCNGANQCKTGFCADGVCCDSACTGLCKACSQSRTGVANGKCAPIASQTDPDGECGGGFCYQGHCCPGVGATPIGEPQAPEAQPVCPAK